MGARHALMEKSRALSEFAHFPTDGDAVQLVQALTKPSGLGASCPFKSVQRQLQRRLGCARSAATAQFCLDCLGPGAQAKLDAHQFRMVGP